MTPQMLPRPDGRTGKISSAENLPARVRAVRTAEMHRVVESSVRANHVLQ